MLRALSLAKKGEGTVEPNPMVGCVLVRDDQCIGEGWHQQFGQAHAEVNAIADAKSNNQPLEGATAYVTLEPCCHTGKTPPCVESLIKAKISRVVVAVIDPNPKVSGQGLAALREAGIEVTIAVCESEARNLLAPFFKLVQQKKPWVTAKWAMTLDGKIATASGDSEWISNEESRRKTHLLRSRVDAIMVGSGTAKADNPKLTVRLSSDGDDAAASRTPLRIVFDSMAITDPNSNLVQTADRIPTLIAVSALADPQRIQRLTEAGVEVWTSKATTHRDRLDELLLHLGQRDVTHLLVEGGGGLLGLFHELDQIDEVHAFVAPKLLGGKGSISPVGGLDRQHLADASQLELVSAERLQDDVYMVLRRPVLGIET